MVSNRKIGYQTVDRYVREVLEPEGWICAKAGRATRFAAEDFFGLFDLMAFRSGVQLLVQIKTQQARSTFTEIKAWAETMYDDLPPYCILRLAVLKRPSMTKPERWSVRDITYDEDSELWVES